MVHRSVNNLEYGRSLEWATRALQLGGLQGEADSLKRVRPAGFVPGRS